MTLFHPLRCTASEFASGLQDHCGRGYEQALALYQCFVREGKVRCDLPQFRNCPRLYDQMVQATNLHVDPVTLVQNSERATKFLMETHDGYLIESVIMSMHSRRTLCISSQIGCRMGCSFCHTGQMGWRRNLAAEEIVAQLFAARHVLRSPIHNVVFMGMGEPFDNYDAMMQAARVMADPRAFGIGRRRMTISTSGELCGIERFAKERGETPNLAVSIGGPTDAIRTRLMPRRRTESLTDLYRVMHDYCGRKKQQILISYVLLQDINDSLECAEQLTLFLQGLGVRVNVIPYNASPGSRYACPSPSTIQAFVECLRKCGLPVFLRHERGASIQAACGQLGHPSQSRSIA